MHTPLVSTIIVSFNTAELTCQAVQSALDEYKHSLIDGEVIVVDNNSSDNSVTQLNKQFGKRIQLIESKKNLGFAAGNNLGIQKSTGRYILLLNSDARLHTGALKALLNVFEKYKDKNTAQQAHTHEIDRVGIVSGKLLNPDGSLQKQGGALPSLLTISLWWLFPLPVSFSFFPNSVSYHIENDHFFEREQIIGWLGGTALMIKRAVIDEIGVLDEGIFMYAEDVEYCLRASDHHWDIVYTPDAEITHFGSASGSSAKATLGEVIGLEYVAVKHFPAWKAELTRKILRLGSLLRLCFFGILLGNGKKKETYQEAFKALASDQLR